MVPVDDELFVADVDEFALCGGGVVCPDVDTTRSPQTRIAPLTENEFMLHLGLTMFLKAENGSIDIVETKLHRPGPVLDAETLLQDFGLS